VTDTPTEPTPEPEPEPEPEEVTEGGSTVDVSGMGHEPEAESEAGEPD